MAVSRLCSIADCGKHHAAHGFCQMHFKRWRRYGDPMAMRRPEPDRSPPKNCTIPGCLKLSHSFGLCVAHYTRRRRHGDPLGGNTGIGVPLQWLRDHVGYQGDDCLTWPFAHVDQGGVVTFEGRMHTAASVMCLFVYGPKPTPRHEAAHNCGKAHEFCINPRHLRWDTRSGNHKDKYAHGTMLLGEQVLGHILTRDQVLEVRKRREPVRAMAERYGMTISGIYAVLNRRTWAWLD